MELTHLVSTANTLSRGLVAATDRVASCHH